MPAWNAHPLTWGPGCDASDDDAAVEPVRLEARLDYTTFAWLGPTERGGVASYRVQGADVFIEYAPRGSTPAANEDVHVT